MAQNHFTELLVRIHNLEGSQDGDKCACGPDQLCCICQGYHSGKNLAIGGGKMPDKVKLQLK